MASDTPPTEDLDLVLAHQDDMLDGMDYTPTDGERLGLIVGAAYGNALAERDQARDLATELGNRYAEALTHLEATLPAEPPTWAADEDAWLAAREFLAKAVESDHSPEQEPTT